MSPKNIPLGKITEFYKINRTKKALKAFHSPIHHILKIKKIERKYKEYKKQDTKD